MTSVKARKKFVVIAYDIVKDKQRNKIAKLLEDIGIRINFSVFECMLTSTQFADVQNEISKYVDKKTDTVVYYTLCVDCFAKIIVQPNNRKPFINSTNIV